MQFLQEKFAMAKSGAAANYGELEPFACGPRIKSGADARFAASGFGKIVLGLMMLPRYRTQTIGDLSHLVLDPLIRDRIAIAHSPKANEGQLSDIAGVAIWASVSDEVDKSIREQIRAGVFPVRLKPDDWTSGNNNWLLDVIAPDSKTTASVIANFGRVVKEGNLKLHPIVTRLVDDETLKKMGAEKMGSKQ